MKKDKLISYKRGRKIANGISDADTNSVRRVVKL